MPATSYLYYLCDVFTDTRFGGNPLAVFPHAEGLTPELMQRIAREFNFSETTFVFAPRAGGTRWVRIFTPTKEVPFAGHPNIGTAFVLAKMEELGELSAPLSIRFEEAAGDVPITIQVQEGGIRCELAAPQPLSLGQSLSPETLAAAVSLEPEAIILTTHVPQVASVGLPFIIAEVKDPLALARARVNLAGFDALAATGVVPDVHLYTHSRDDFDLRTRMFAPFDNVPEDPATGSANCALAALLSHYHPATDGSFAWRIAQGVEMGRPSLLEARSEKREGVVSGVWIAGHSVMVARGMLELD